MSFLPTDYIAPNTSNNYMKLQAGENRIRILSKPIVGWEDWKDKKPVRFRMNEKPVKSIDPLVPIKHFWSFIVFNYREECIQIYQVNQATIRNRIESLSKDTDWGVPFAYDIKIIKTGEGKDTEYSVNPVPHKPTDPYIVELFNEKKCNLEALFSGEDPFSAYDIYTPMGTVEDSLVKKKISDIQVAELNNILEKCPKNYKEKFLDSLSEMGFSCIEEMPIEIFERAKLGAIKNQLLLQKTGE